MPIHYDTIEDGQTTNLIFYSLNLYCDTVLILSKFIFQDTAKEQHNVPNHNLNISSDPKEASISPITTPISTPTPVPIPTPVPVSIPTRVPVSIPTPIPVPIHPPVSVPIPPPVPVPILTPVSILVPVRHNLVISSDPKEAAIAPITAPAVIPTPVPIPNPVPVHFSQDISLDPKDATTISNTTHVPIPTTVPTPVSIPTPVPIPTSVPIPIPVPASIPVPVNVPPLAHGPPPLKYCRQGSRQDGRNQVPSCANHMNLNTNGVKPSEDSQKSPEEMSSDKLILVQEDGDLSYVEVVSDVVEDTHQRKRKSSGQLREMTASKRIRKQTCVVSLVEADGHVTDAKLVNYDFFKASPLQKKKLPCNKVDETNLQGKKQPHAIDVDLSNYVLVLPQDGKVSSANLAYKAGYEAGMAVAPAIPPVSSEEQVAQVQDILTNNGSNNQGGNSKEMLPFITEVVSLNPEFRKESEKLSNH